MTGTDFTEKNFFLYSLFASRQSQVIYRNLHFFYVACHTLHYRSDCCIGGKALVAPRVKLLFAPIYQNPERG